MGYQVDYHQRVRLRGCVTELNGNARGRNRAVIGDGVSKLSSQLWRNVPDMLWYDAPSLESGMDRLARPMFLVNIDGTRLLEWDRSCTWQVSEFQLFNLRLTKTPFFVNFLISSEVISRNPSNSKRKSLNKGGALAPLSNTDWGHNKGLFSRTILWLMLGSPSLRGRLAKRGKLQQQPSETKLHLSHFKKLPTYTSPPTSREMAAISGGFHSACSATGLCLMRGSLFDINYWIESAAQEGCQSVHHCASSNSLSQRWII